jgi:non-reducing end alpha-L-arabinofuranosidase
MTLAPVAAVATPSGVQTFSPKSSQDSTVTFTNTTGAPVTNLKLAIAAPLGWTAVANGPATIAGPVAPGASVSATFKVTSGPAAFNGDLVANATFTANGKAQSEKAIEKVRNAASVKINEFRIAAGANQTDSFIELYNAGSSAADISGWTLTHHSAPLPVFSSVKVPAGTSVASKGFYVIGLSNSGLSVPAKIGDSTVYVRSIAGMNAGSSITIGTGAGAETRKIASIGTAAGNPTTMWQPLPEGPVITIPVGSTNIPYTGQGGGRGAPEQPMFTVGQKVALGYGATYPTISRSTEKYEVVTVTAVGKPGTQAWTTAPAKAGETNIKVSNLTNITAGDKIRLDIDSVGHGIEWVTVKSVGTASTRNAFNGVLRPEELGTGLELTAPLKFNHSSNIPFSARGTGLTFKPATAFPHSSNEPILAQGEGIKLDAPLAKAHAIDSVVSDASVTTAGYQGKPNQWFGGPVLAGTGAMALRNATGLLVDTLNYGGLVDAWAAEGFHTTAGGSACTVPAPSAGGRGGGFGGQAAPAGGPNRSSGRITDGLDTDSNCSDFAVQSATSLAAPSAAGATNIKVASVADLSAGQTIYVDSGANQQTAVIASVGTAGATTVGTATAAGATVITVAGAAGFTAGQAIIVDSGANAENAVVVSATGGRGGFGGGGGGGRGGQAPAMTVTVSAPLKLAHAVGAQVAGTGLTLTAPLSRAHDSGAQVAGNVPTPGAPNQYARSTSRR